MQKNVELIKPCALQPCVLRIRQTTKCQGTVFSHGFRTVSVKTGSPQRVEVAGGAHQLRLASKPHWIGGAPGWHTQDMRRRTGTFSI